MTRQLTTLSRRLREAVEKIDPVHVEEASKARRSSIFDGIALRIKRDNQHALTRKATIEAYKEAMESQMRERQEIEEKQREEIAQEERRAEEERLKQEAEKRRKDREAREQAEKAKAAVRLLRNRPHPPFPPSSPARLCTTAHALVATA